MDPDCQSEGIVVSDGTLREVVALFQLIQD
jgi:hypothetical protein